MDDDSGQSAHCYGSEGWAFESLRAPSNSPSRSCTGRHCCQICCQRTSRHGGARVERTLKQMIQNGHEAGPGSRSNLVRTGPAAKERRLK